MKCEKIGCNEQAKYRDVMGNCFCGACVELLIEDSECAIPEHFSVLEDECN